MKASGGFCASDLGDLGPYIDQASGSLFTYRSAGVYGAGYYRQWSDVAQAKDLAPATVASATHVTELDSEDEHGSNSGVEISIHPDVIEGLPARLPGSPPPQLGSNATTDVPSSKARSREATAKAQSIRSKEREKPAPPSLQFDSHTATSSDSPSGQSRKRKRWSDNEVEALRAGVRRHGKGRCVCLFITRTTTLAASLHTARLCFLRDFAPSRCLSRHAIDPVAGGS